jgi:hypothetical protein
VPSIAARRSALPRTRSARTCIPPTGTRLLPSCNENGISVEDIGARFGVMAVVVRQRLKLGAISPKLMTLYGKGEIISINSRPSPLPRAADSGGVF